MDILYSRIMYNNNQTYTQIFESALEYNARLCRYNRAAGFFMQIFIRLHAQYLPSLVRVVR